MIQIPPRADMAATMALAAELREKIDMTIDGAAVSMCGAAMAQLLLVLDKTLREAGDNLHWHAMSEAMRNDLMILGLTEWLRKGECHV